MGRYVLCKVDPQYGAAVCICGGPFPPTFDIDVERAARFDSIEEALIVRAGLPHLLGGKHKYRVHEVLPDGTIVDVEG